MIEAFFAFHQFYVNHCKKENFSPMRDCTHFLNEIEVKDRSDACIFASGNIISLIFERAEKIALSQQHSRNYRSGYQEYRDFVNCIKLYELIIEPELRTSLDLELPKTRTNSYSRALANLIIEGWIRGYNILEYVYFVLKKTNLLFFSEQDVIDGIKQAEKFHKLEDGQLMKDWIFIIKSKILDV